MKPAPPREDIEFGSTVITASNKEELIEILHWCLYKGKRVSGFLAEWTSFPVHISASGENVGYTDHSDRALYYMPFSKFLEKSGADSPTHFTDLVGRFTTLNHN